MACRFRVLGSTRAFVACPSAFSLKASKRSLVCTWTYCLPPPPPTTPSLPTMFFSDAGEDTALSWEDGGVEARGCYPWIHTATLLCD